MNQVASNGIIKIHAGDSFTTTFFLNVGDNFEPIQYVLEEFDKVYVGIMEPNQSFAHAIIRKVLTADDLAASGDPIFRLSPEDTECLMPGLYYYEVKLQPFKLSASDTVITVIPKTKFYILE